MTITPKYIGHQRLVEIAISTLVTDRALLLIGEPGTAKSWLSEHLAAAINGDSTKVVQGTAGTTEEQIRYTWNYAMLIARGPSHEALIKSPIFRAMESGTLARFEEITRCAVRGAGRADLAAVGEAHRRCRSWRPRCRRQKGFSIIATANTRDRGVNDMSAALKRRFNMVVLPTPDDAGNRDRDRPQARRASWRSTWSCRPTSAGRGGGREGRHHLPRAAHRARRSTARTSSRRPPACSPPPRRSRVLANSMALAGNFGTGEVTAHDLAAGLQGAVVKDEEKDTHRLAGVSDERAEEARRRVAAAVHGLLGAQRSWTSRRTHPGKSTSSACGTCRRSGRGTCAASSTACGPRSC